jgi:hypothetical protein
MEGDRYSRADTTNQIVTHMMELIPQDRWRIEMPLVVAAVAEAVPFFLEVQQQQDELDEQVSSRTDGGDGRAEHAAPASRS